MLMSIVSHILTAWFAFILPSFSTFKALSHRPLSEPELERWAMYWSVIGAYVAFQYTVEWLFNWFPFYVEAKTVFLLFLSLPQTQGSTFVYKSYLQPFFTKNEAELDAGIVSAQKNTVTFVQTRLSALFDIVLSLLSKQPAAGQQPAGSAGQPAGPTLSLENAMGLWRTYGPSVMGAISHSAAPAQSASAPSPAAAAASASTSSFQAGETSTEQRLATAPESDHVVPHTPIGTPTGSSDAAPPAFPEPQFH